MVQIAERASILDREADKILLIERANHLWDRQAIFDWEMVAFSSCSSIVSDDDSIDEEGNGLAFNSPSREDNIANYYTEIGSQITLKQPFSAQELFACQLAQPSDPSWTKCHSCGVALIAETGTLCDSCSRYFPPCEAGKLHHAQASLTIPAPSIYSAPQIDDGVDSSQGMAEASFHSLVDNTSYQGTQHSSCLGCDTAMWPGFSFCFSCSRRSDPPENPFNASSSKILHVPHVSPLYTRSGQSGRN